MELTCDANGERFDSFNDSTLSMIRRFDASFWIFPPFFFFFLIKILDLSYASVLSFLKNTMKVVRRHDGKQWRLLCSDETGCEQLAVKGGSCKFHSRKPGVAKAIRRYPEGIQIFWSQPEEAVEDEQTPVEDEQMPVEDEQTPVEDEQMPVEDEQAPVEDVPAPVPHYRYYRPPNFSGTYFECDLCATRFSRRTFLASATQQ